MYIDIDAVLPTKKITTYAPLNDSIVGKEVMFSFDLVPKCSEYKLQVKKMFTKAKYKGKISI